MDRSEIGRTGPAEDVDIAKQEMGMQIHVCQHVAFETAGAIGDWIAAKGGVASVTRLWQGDRLPDPGAIGGLVVTGGPMGVHQDEHHPWLTAEKRFIEGVLAAGKPVLGVCLGAQLVAHVLGARVFANTHKEIGWFPIRRLPEGEASPFGRRLPPEVDVLHWHGDTFDLPAGAVPLAASDACANQGFAVGDHVLALQFHLEVSRQGLIDLIDNCRHELIRAPFIQPAETMLADENRFTRTNRLLPPLLDRLFADQ
jgi:GMP synthase-like glutamine amidotransferase